MKDPEDLNWFQRLFPPKQLIAVSKPGDFWYHTVNTKTGRQQPGSKKDITVRLYLQGTKRSFTVSCDPKTFKELGFEEFEFWVDTGKFGEDKYEEHFEWLLTDRQLAKHYLKYLVAN